MRKGETEQQQKVSLSTEQSEMHSKFRYQVSMLLLKVQQRVQLPILTEITSLKFLIKTQ